MPPAQPGLMMYAFAKHPDPLYSSKFHSIAQLFIIAPAKFNLEWRCVGLPFVLKAFRYGRFFALPAQDAAAFVEEDALEVHLELFGTGRAGHAVFFGDDPALDHLE